MSEKRVELSVSGSSVQGLKTLAATRMTSSQRKVGETESADSVQGVTRAGSQSGAAPEIVELTPVTSSAWDAFVAQAPNGLPQHLSGWEQVLKRVYGYETRFVMAIEAGSMRNGEGPHVRGVLPLFGVSSRLLGKTAMTMPGGLCAADDRAAQALLAFAQDAVRESGAKCFALRDSRVTYAGMQAGDGHEARILDLQPGREAVWKGLDRNIRRQVRMAERNGVTIEIDRTGARLDDFYTVMARFTHQAGTPIFSRSFLEQVTAAFPKGVHLALAYHEGQPVGGYFQLILGRTLYGVWGATVPRALPLRTVYLAYWELMADAMDNGFTRLDMGRSPAGSNAAKYKAQWGGIAEPVYQQIWRPEDHESPAIAGTPAQTAGRFDLFRRVWPLLPYRLSLWLGPIIRRHVPFG